MVLLPRYSMIMTIANFLTIVFQNILITYIIDLLDVLILIFL